MAGIEASGSQEGGELNDEGRFYDSHHVDEKNGSALPYVTKKRITYLVQKMNAFIWKLF